MNDYLQMRELYHSAKGTTWSKKDHEYIEKIYKNGRAYYVYDKKTGTTKELNKKEAEDLIKSMAEKSAFSFKATRALNYVFGDWIDRFLHGTNVYEAPRKKR